MANQSQAPALAKPGDLLDGLAHSEAHYFNRYGLHALMMFLIPMKLTMRLATITMVSSGRETVDTPD
jgi:hypothetical protein